MTMGTTATGQQQKPVRGDETALVELGGDEELRV
jgi:hypothetical protein